MNQKILLVDDENDILEFLSYNLNKEGFEVYTAPTGEHAIFLAHKIVPDLIVLDIMMPEMDGIEVCKRIRDIDKLSHAIIVFLSAAGETGLKKTSLQAGADEYIEKPIDVKILCSKIQLLLLHPKDFPWQRYDLEIDRSRFSITFLKKTYQFPKKEFELIELLVSAPNKVFTREEIYQKLWNNTLSDIGRSIDTHVRRIRKRVHHAKIIETIKGIGYKLGTKNCNIRS